MVKCALGQEKVWSKKMVTQRKTQKVSSTNEIYEFSGALRYVAHRPAMTSVGEGEIFGRLDDKELVEHTEWKEPPHEALANLRLEPKSVEAFIKRYGLLYVEDVEWPPDEILDLDDVDQTMYRTAGCSFRSKIEQFGKAQDLLRRAWRGEILALVDIEGQLEGGFKSEALDLDIGKLILKTPDLWKFICFSFLLDLGRERLETCQHPDCPAPFFRKGRKNQKFCQLGPCTEYAQRQYALKWWNDKGTKKRAEKRGGRRRTKR